jgi:hypothetical protein
MQAPTLVRRPFLSAALTLFALISAGSATACLGPPADFGQDAVVTEVPRGTHDLLVYTLDCQTSTLVGQTTVVVGQASSIPTLDFVGFAALTLLIAAVGL